MQTNVEIATLFLGEEDIKTEFLSMDIFEDINTNCYYGTLSIQETEGIRESIPIICEETVSVSFKSIDPITGASSDPTISFIFHVTSIEDYVIGTDKKRNYRLKLASLPHRFQFSSGRQRKFYSGNTADIVSRLINNTLLSISPLFESDEDKYSNDYIFPNWHPLRCINFLTTNAISATYNDPYYLFYEDRDGWHYTSLSFLMAKGNQGTITDEIKNTTDTRTATDGDNMKLISYENAKLINTYDNIYGGMYGSSLVGYDKFNKTYTESSQTYAGTWGQFTHVGETQLLKSFPESVKYSAQYVIENQPENPGIYDFSHEIHKERVIRTPQMMNNMWVVTLPANTKIKTGAPITFKLPSTLYPDGSDDEYLSGNYLVKTVHHALTPDNLYTKLTIIKDGLKK